MQKNNDTYNYMFMLWGFCTVTNVSFFSWFVCLLLSWLPTDPHWIYGQYIIGPFHGEMGYHFRPRTCSLTKNKKMKTWSTCNVKPIETSPGLFLQMALKRAQREPMIYLEGPGVFYPVAEGPYAPVLCSSEQPNERISGHGLEIWKAVLLNWGFI